MFEMNNKQYIFKLSTGQVINVFYKFGGSICIRTISAINNWSEPFVLLENALSDFSACMDDKDTIHILSQEKSGELVHTYSSGSEWKSRLLKRERSSKPCCKFSTIISIGKKVFFFYVLEELEKKALLYQINDEQNQISSPQMIDWVKSGRKLPFRLLEHSSTLYVFYSRTDGKSHQIVSRTYNQAKNEWNVFKLLSSSEENVETHLISVISDIHDSIHACWQKSTSNKCELIYSRKEINSDAWKNHILASSPFDFYNCSIMSLDDKIIVYWVREKNIFYCISEDRGGKWSPPKKYLFLNNKPFYCIQYMQNAADNQNGIFTNELPGIYTQGYQFGFIDDFSCERKERDDMSDFQSLMVNTMKILSGSLEELKKSMDHLQKKVSELEHIQKQSESDLTQYTSKLDLVHLDISNVKSEVKDLKDTVDHLKVEDLIRQCENNYTPVKDQTTVLTVQPVQSQRILQEQSNEPEELKSNSKTASMMPGTGFSYITPEFLRNLGKTNID